MATLREYFDTDFANAVRVYLRIGEGQSDVDAALLYDFSAYTAFLACYVRGSQHDASYFLWLLEAWRPGVQVSLDGRVVLPSARMFPGALEIQNSHPFIIRAKFHGNPEWMSTDEIPTSTRIFIYSESQLAQEDIVLLQGDGRRLGHKVQFRSKDHAEARSQFENPMAFISHDSRDNAVAKEIALGLQKMVCPVWYDEFSLRVGANLRDSIEAGLKKSHKCVLVLSKHFFSNSGWTKKEFDSVFTREIHENRALILPVWIDVSPQNVYDYSPSLLNIKALDWNRLGGAEVCRQLYNAIVEQAPIE